MSYYIKNYIDDRRYLSYFYSLRFPPNFGGNLSEGAAWKATSSFATVPKKTCCVRFFGLDELGALT
jgi:hypothetical protein